MAYTEHIDREVHVTFLEIIERDYEEFLDLISELSVGDEGVLCDITYSVVRLAEEDNALVIRVQGYLELDEG